MTIYVNPPSDVDNAIFGYGINFLTGQRIGQTCVVGLPAPVARTPSDSGDTIRTILVEDSQSFSNLMSTVSSLSASGLSWSASASVSYLREAAGDDTAITFTWTRVVRSKDRVADYTQAKIDSVALALLKSGGSDAFIAAYGTHCMIGLAYGGSFSGFTQLKTASVSHKEQLKADIGGSVSGFAVSGSVAENFSESLSASSVDHSSSQDAEVIGASPIAFTGLDIAAMQHALETFELTTSSGDVAGVPIAAICVTWDQFSDIVAALGEKNAADAFQYSGEQTILSALSDEYSALSYLSGTVATLTALPAIVVPAYLPSVQKIGTHIDTVRSQIAALGMADVTKLISNGYSPLILSSTVAPILGWVGRGQAKVQLSYALDWAFGSPNSSPTLTVTPGGGEQHIGTWDHVRPEGDGERQQMALYYTVANGSGGTPTFSVRMHWHDPYGPPGDADYVSETVPLAASSQIISASAAWPSYPANWISIKLVMPANT
ncbi:MAG: hypothetical protein EOP62_04130 [Sphingomonadales bacterium]|nr:MAG: hypothetical protein EOP62_04130 [Sphingomonadales bacterium]